MRCRVPMVVALLHFVCKLLAVGASSCVQYFHLGHTTDPKPLAKKVPWECHIHIQEVDVIIDRLWRSVFVANDENHLWNA